MDRKITSKQYLEEMKNKYALGIIEMKRSWEEGSRNIDFCDRIPLQELWDVAEVQKPYSIVSNNCIQMSETILNRGEERACCLADINRTTVNRTSIIAESKALTLEEKGEEQACCLDNMISDVNNRTTTTTTESKLLTILEKGGDFSSTAEEKTIITTLANNTHIQSSVRLRSLPPPYTPVFTESSHTGSANCLQYALQPLYTPDLIRSNCTGTEIANQSAIKNSETSPFSLTCSDSSIMNFDFSSYSNTTSASTQEHFIFENTNDWHENLLGNCNLF